ncbi:response regulator transcription factor [Gallaecimonas mangrovi]|uniref:response regulator transcription factor n=1 Tax=Gallaecimonas mangrovi TaxID=2291597 RepID=UPI000E205AD9|nr:response regulator transcription factor [Gallaecimonas mangrovi]
MRVLLIEDQDEASRQLAAVITSLDYELVAVDQDSQQLSHLIEVKTPDLVILDVSSDWQEGLDALRAVRSRWHRLPVILLSLYDSGSYVLKGMSLGASGFIPKDAAADELAVAMASVRDGHRYLSPQVVSSLLDVVTEKPEEDAGDIILTKRQVEVLHWLALGKTNKEVAQILDLSVKTVDSHRAQIMDRLGVSGLAGLVVYALRKGIISP